VPFEDALFYRTQRPFDGGNLVENVNAVLFLIHHSLDAANLPLNSPQG
jgi:hypothetical protein